MGSLAGSGTNEGGLDKGLSGFDTSVWDKSVDVLKSSLDPQIFSAWIKPLSISRMTASAHVSDAIPQELHDGTDIDGEESESNSAEVELIAPNKFCCDHVRRNYSELISSAVANVSGLKKIRLCFKVEGSSGTISSPSSAATSSASAPYRVGDQFATALERLAPKGQQTGTADTSVQPREGTSAVVSKEKRVSRPISRFSRGTSGTNLNPRYNFSNFVIGGCNQFAHAVSMRISQGLGSVYNPLFIYGGVGLGKTHLVNAIGNTALRQGKNVLLVSSELFVNELIAALRSNRMQQFKSKFRSLDLLIVDDIQFLIGKERTQEEFFHTFNDLYNRHRQIVITSDKTPQELIGLEERLRTRFASGLSADLQAPDFETRTAILIKKAEADGVSLNQDVAQLLAQRIDTNVRELEGALNRLRALSSLQSRPITVDFTEQALKTLVPDRTREITPDLIQRYVAERYNVGLNDLLGKRRTQNIAFARHMAMYLCRRLTARSFPEIGMLFGGRDHSTVIHATRVIEERIRKDGRVKSDYEQLERKLKTP